MPDCNPHDCTVLPRVEALEESNKRNSDTHREIFRRLNTLERATDTQAETLRNIDEKLDEVRQTVNSLAEKPGRRWDGLVDKMLYVAALAALLWVAAGMPGLGG